MAREIDAHQGRATFGLWRGDIISRALKLPPARSGLETMERGITWLNAATIVVMMALMVALVVLNVACRKLLNFSIIYAEELSQFLMVWSVFGGAGLAFRQGRHVAVEMLQDKLPGRVASVLRWFVLLGTAAFLAVLVVLGVQYSVRTWDQQTPVLQISTGAVYLAMPIGAALFLFHLMMTARAFAARQFETMDSLETDLEEGR